MKQVQWVTLDEPFKWRKHNLTVIADGHLDCGTRVHVVEEEQPICKIANAYVFSKNYLEKFINE